MLLLSAIRLYFQEELQLLRKGTQKYCNLPKGSRNTADAETGDTVLQTVQAKFMKTLSATLLRPHVEHGVIIPNKYSINNLNHN